MPTAGRGAPPPARRRHHHRRSVLLSWFHGRVVVSAADGTRGRIMVVKRAVPISTLELQSRVFEFEFEFEFGVGSGSFARVGARRGARSQTHPSAAGTNEC